MHCDKCLWAESCGGENTCEHFFSAYEDDTYPGLDSDIYNEYCEDYWNYLKEFNR